MAESDNRAETYKRLVESVLGRSVEIETEPIWPRYCKWHDGRGAYTFSCWCRGSLDRFGNISLVGPDSPHCRQELSRWGRIRKFFSLPIGPGDKMKIETRYDIGDEVWSIGRADSTSWRTEGSKGVLDELRANKDSSHLQVFVRVSYYHKGSFSWSRFYPLTDLFPTREEARTECDRRNKE